jgi:hypothetical protein
MKGWLPSSSSDKQMAKQRQEAKAWIAGLRDQFVPYDIGPLLSGERVGFHRICSRCRY